MYVIRLCVKPPGIIFAARTYRLVLNDKGLYLIHIGRAMGPKVQSNNAMANRLADGMISNMERNMMAKLAAREEGIDDANLDKELPLSKKSRFFGNPSEVQMSFNAHNHSGGRLKLKGKGVHLNLNIDPSDAGLAQAIVDNFKR